MLFQLSFLRLPTEEGHLLPAFICLFLILKINLNRLSLAVLLLVFFANFIDLKFYEVDVPNHASQAFLNIKFEDGFLIEDFRERAFKGLDKNFNYQNAKKSVYDASPKVVLMYKKEVALVMYARFPSEMAYGTHIVEVAKGFVKNGFQNIYYPKHITRKQ